MNFKSHLNPLFTNLFNASNLCTEYHNFNPGGAYFHPILGLINPKEILLYTPRSMPDVIGDLPKPHSEDGYIYLSNTHPLFTEVQGILNNKINNLGSELQQVVFCPCNPRLLLTILDTDFWGGIGNEGVTPAGSGTNTTPSRDEGILFYPNNILFNLLPTANLIIDDSGLPVYDEVRVHPYLQEIRIGVVEKKPSGSANTHLELVNKIVSNGKYVTPVLIPINSRATVFDLICSLSNCKLDRVDIVNISQGYYSQVANYPLYEALSKIKKPIICSAGNALANNDICGHWPSNYSTALDQLIAVGAIDHRGIYQNIPPPRPSGSGFSNHGPVTVTLSSQGVFRDGNNQEIAGTSFAAALVSKMVGIAFSVSGNTSINLTEVKNIINSLSTTMSGFPFRVEEIPTQRMHTNLSFAFLYHP